MRKYISSFGEEFDLDNPDTYKHLPDDLNKLDNMMFKEIGQALVYMDYFRKELFLKKDDYYHNSGGFNQRQRIKKLIKDFSENRHKNYKNKMWYKEQIFLFQDETENMC